MSAPKFFILDLMNLAYRSYYSHSGLATSKGHPTGVCYGMAGYINRLVREHSPDFIVFAGDAKGKTFRHDMFEGYKANRGPQPEDFQLQFQDLKRMIAAYGIKIVESPGYEADDVIGSIAKKAAGRTIQSFEGQEISEPIHVYIVSGDKDFMQCIGPHVSLLRIMNDGDKLCDSMSVFEKFGVDRPEQVIDALALIGDSVDCVPGVKGIGEKGAAKLLKSFGSVEGIYDNLHLIGGATQRKLIEGREMAILSKRLVTIATEIPIDLKLSETYVQTIQPLAYKPELDAIFQELEFYSMRRSLEG
jgi:5'-3' exonuclease